MEHKYKEHYDAAKKYNGGLILFIDLLDKYDVDYVLTSKNQTARVSITTKYGKLGIYDRKENKLIRMDIPNKHPLHSQYEKYNGFLYNKSNKLTKEEYTTAVYFAPNDFVNLIEAIKSYM